MRQNCFWDSIEETGKEQMEPIWVKHKMNGLNLNSRRKEIRYGHCSEFEWRKFYMDWIQISVKGERMNEDVVLLSSGLIFEECLHWMDSSNGKVLIFSSTRRRKGTNTPRKPGFEHLPDWGKKVVIDSAATPSSNRIDCKGFLYGTSFRSWFEMKSGHDKWHL